MPNDDQLLTRLRPFDIKAFMNSTGNPGTMTLTQAIAALQGETLTYVCPQCPDGASGNNGYVDIPGLSFTTICPTCKGMLKTDVPYFLYQGNYVALVITGYAGSIIAGATVQLSATIPGGQWSTADQTIATVNAQSGLVTAVAAGQVNISYTYNQVAVSIKITVTA